MEAVIVTTVIVGLLGTAFGGEKKGTKAPRPTSKPAHTTHRHSNILPPHMQR